MKGIAILVYCYPRISLIKRLGYMRENGRPVAREVWENTTARCGQASIKLTWSDIPTKREVVERVSAMLMLCKADRPSTVRVIANGGRIDFPSVSALNTENTESSWQVLLQTILEVPPEAGMKITTSEPKEDTDE